MREVHLINPHSWIYLEVQDDQDEPVIWALESTTPDGLQRRGIQPDFVRIGDRVKFGAIVSAITTARVCLAF